MNDGIKHAHARRISLMKGGALYSYSYSTVQYRTVQDEAGTDSYGKVQTQARTVQYCSTVQYSQYWPARRHSHRLTDSQTHSSAIRDTRSCTLSTNV